MSEHRIESLPTGRGPGLYGVLAEAAIVAIALLVNVLVRWVTLDDLDVALSNAHDVLALEQEWGLDWEHGAQDAVHAVSWLGTFASWFYVWGYLPVVVLALVALYVRLPRDYALLRNALLAGGLAGLPVYVLYPLAPPRLTGLGYADTVRSSIVEGAARPPGIANEIAAMPSFHVGYLVVVSVVVWSLTQSRPVRTWCVVHPLVMCWVVLATGNHWFLDLPAGLALAVVGLGAANWIQGRTDARPTPRTPLEVLN